MTLIKPEKQVIVMGAGGHARVLIDTLRIVCASVIGVMDPARKKKSESSFCGYPILGDDSELHNYPSENVLLVNALGFLPGKIIELIHVAPLQDPITLRIENQEISVRKADANFVEVVELVEC